MDPLALPQEAVQSKACEGWVIAKQGWGAEGGGRVAGAWQHACSASGGVEGVGEPQRLVGGCKGGLHH